MRRKRTASVIAAMLALTLVIAGCVAKDNGQAGKDNNGAAARTEFRMNLSTEPPSMDPAQAKDQVSFTVLGGIYEGLTRMNESGEAEAGAAKDWIVSDDGLTYTFNLREDAKWSNGDALTAHDFEFAWKRALDPNLKPKPSEYAYQLYYIVGGEAYNDGSGSVDAVGVKALNDTTLEVKLNAPTPYFLSLVSFQTYYPVHQSVKDNEAFAADAATMITNGPFKLAEWKRNTSMTLVPNENYHSKADIKLTKVHFTMINDSGSELSMYQTDKLDFAGHPTGSLPTEQLQTLQQSHPDEYQVKGTASLYYYLFNTTAKPFDNVKVRKALSMAMSRKDLTEKVTRGGQLPAYGIVPPGIRGQTEEFRTEVSDNYFTENYDEAKTLLAEGLAESGLSAMPEFTIAYNTNDLHQVVAEAIVEMWRVNLGVNAKIGNQEWGVFLQNRTALNYEVARGGWGADYNDPISFIDLFTSKSGNNNTGYSSPEYDALVNKVYGTGDQKVRMETMAEAEKLIMEAHPVMPIFYYSSVNMIKPGFKNIFIDFKGDINYTRGYYEAE